MFLRAGGRWLAQDGGEPEEAVAREMVESGLCVESTTDDTEDLASAAPLRTRVCATLPPTVV